MSMWTTFRHKITPVLQRTCHWYVVAATCLVVFLTGCSKTSRVNTPDWNGDRLSEAAMTSLDTNTDGVIDAIELDKAPGLKSALKAIDTDNNQLITKQEIAARIAAYDEVGLGMVPYVCAVHYRGKPLGQATVRLIPEDFLREAVVPAIGRSKDSGYCYLRAEGKDMPGVQVGIYRVEITSEEVALPPKYNEQTELGIEVSPGIASGSRPEIDIFDLDN